MRMNIHKIFYWLLILFAIYLIFEIVKKIVGGSLALESLIIGLLLLNIGFSFKLTRDINNVEHKLRKEINNVKNELSEHIGWHKGKNIGL